jgi:Ser/Thr protein kinase RdoA (MazF antagonist)
MTSNLSQDIRDAFELGAAQISAITTGHINTTLLVVQGEEKSILQRLNPIFGPEVHRDIDAITKLVAGEVAMPSLIPTADGHLWFKTQSGEIWRRLEWMPGETFVKAQSLEMCESAGHFVGRFHRALHKKDHSFSHRRLGVHDTQAHLNTLDKALSEHRGHPAFESVAQMATPVRECLEQLEDLNSFPLRICHGDLKISNLLFENQQATGLIDLDTLAPMPLAHEMGDALRSWCNLKDEESPDASFSLSYFEAAMRGYHDATEGLFDTDELLSIACGLETISLELTVRFLADALNESYFGWDPKKYGRASEHNLERARGQWAFACSVGKQRAEAQAVLKRLVA